jgi:hypothetical protein
LFFFEFWTATPEQVRSPHSAVLTKRGKTLEFQEFNKTWNSFPSTERALYLNSETADAPYFIFERLLPSFRAAWTHPDNLSYRNARRGGVDTIGGRKCYQLEIDDPPIMNFYGAKVRVWIETATFLIRRIRFDGASGPGPPHFFVQSMDFDCQTNAHLSKGDFNWPNWVPRQGHISVKHKH